MRSSSLTRPVLLLPYLLKRAIVIGVDASLCVLTVWLAFYLRLGEWTSLNGRPMIAVSLSIGLALPIFAAFGVYRTVFRHFSSETIVTSAFACVVYGLGYSTLIAAYAFNNIPRTIGLIQPVLLFLAVALSRVVAGYWLGGKYRDLLRRKGSARALIYGAGSAGRQLAEAMASSGELKIVGFADDDTSLHGRKIRGLRVHKPDALDSVIPRLGVTEILLALPSVSRRRRNEIIERLREHGVNVRMLPGLMDLAHGTIHASDLREVTIEDLLSREPATYTASSYDPIAGKIVLVTGAGGSIGSELCRQIMDSSPALLLLVEVSEFALYKIHAELAERCSVPTIPLLGSVTDRKRMATILETWRPQMIFHAAAYKHVPLVEHNLIEGLRNNVRGTVIMAELSVEYTVRDFVLISTDKAVRPTNVMGASKRLAEMSVQAIGADSGSEQTCFSMVRFGNVLGSSGSVVPLFKAQIQKGGPITITHRDITRYFMTISEAAQLVIRASAMAVGGEVFVLDMGQPVRIYDLARNMIQLSGLTLRDESNPVGDIEILTVGLRPGEKLFEELLIGNDPRPTQHPLIMMANENYASWEVLEPSLEQLDSAIDTNDVAASYRLLREIVAEFTPLSDLVDWVHNEQQRHEMEAAS